MTGILETERMSVTEDKLWAMVQQEQVLYPPVKLYVDEHNRYTISNYLSWRSDMINWLLDTAGLFGVHSRTVAAAVSILDRFASVDKDITEDFELFQLACFVCLLMACKTQETKRVIKRSKIHELSREVFSQEEYDCMEMHILYSLQWRIHPPTAADFASMLLEVVPTEALPDRERVEEAVSAILETALVDARFLPFKSSSIALAVVMKELQPILKIDLFLDMQEDFENALEFEEIIEDELQELQAMMIPHDGIPYHINILDSSKSDEYYSASYQSGILSSPELSPRSVFVED